MTCRRLSSAVIVFVVLAGLARPGLGQDFDDPVPSLQTQTQTQTPETSGTAQTADYSELVEPVWNPRDQHDLFSILRKIFESLLGPGFQATVPDPLLDTPPDEPAKPEPKPATPGTVKPPASGSVTPPVSLGAVTEDEFESKATEIIAALKAAGIKPGSMGGDSAAKREIPGFPAWFGELQSLICGSIKWGDTQEAGRGLLRDYANQWAARNLPQPTFHSLTYFFERLGCTESNYAGIQAYNKDLPSAGDLSGNQNKWEWCAAASNKAFTAPIEAAGFKLSGGMGWANNAKYVKTYGAGNKNVKIEVGDYVTTPKHVMTVVAVRGDKLLVVSGNAGGGAEPYKGTVRMEEINTSSITVVKKHAPLDLATIQAHADDPKWLAAHGISKK